MIPRDFTLHSPVPHRLRKILFPDSAAESRAAMKAEGENPSLCIRSSSTGLVIHATQKEDPNVSCGTLAAVTQKLSLLRDLLKTLNDIPATGQESVQQKSLRLSKIHLNSISDVEFVHANPWLHEKLDESDVDAGKYCKVIMKSAEDHIRKVLSETLVVTFNAEDAGCTVSATKYPHVAGFGSDQKTALDDLVDAIVAVKKLSLEKDFITEEDYLSIAKSIDTIKFIAVQSWEASSLRFPGIKVISDSLLIVKPFVDEVVRVVGSYQFDND